MVFTHRFAWRLFLGWMLILGAVVVAVALVAMNRLYAVRLEEGKRAGLAEVRLVYALIRDDLVHHRQPELRQAVARLATATDSRLTIIAADGVVLADSSTDPAQMENHRLRPEVVEAYARGEGEAVRWSHTLEQDMLYLVTRHDEDNGATTYVRLAAPLARLRGGRSSFDTTLACLLLAVLLVGGAAGAGVAWRVGGRIAELNRLAGALARNEVSGRAHVPGGCEVAELARALNTIAENLERVRGEAAREEEELRAILESMNDGVVATDALQRVIWANAAAGRLLGEPLAPDPARPLWAQVREDILLKGAAEVLSTGRPLTVQWGPLGGRYLQAALLPLQHKAQPPGLLLVIRDQTREVQYQELRKEFATNVSHELRTPLSIIQGFVETLRGGALRDEVKGPEYLAIIEKRVNHLTNLVNNLLELSRLENRAGVTGQASVDLAGLLSRVAEAMRPAAQNKAQTLDLESAEDLPLVTGSPEYLERAVSNLLDNAIKYTPERGAIRLRAFREGEHVVVSVSDNGIGIPEKDLARVFERFYRVDKSRSREFGGTGLGLAIVKHIAQAHGGTVEVTSQPGAGSTFRLVLPVRAAAG